MFKILVILFLLLLVGGAITRRAIRVFAIGALIVLLIREIGRLDFNYISVSSCCPASCCKQLVLSDVYQQDIQVADHATLMLTCAVGGTVKVHGWDESFVRLSTTKRASTQEDLEKLSIGIKTDVQSEGPAHKIEMTGDVHDSTWSMGDGWLSVAGSRSRWSGVTSCVDFDLFVPRSTIKDVIVRLGSGLIDVNSVDVTSLLDVNLRSGRVALQGVSGNVKVSSSSAQVDVADIKGSVEVSARSGCASVKSATGDASISTSSGQIRLANIGGSAIAQARSGSIIMDGVRGDLKAKSSSGSITLSEVAGPVDASARSGSIRIKRAVQARGVIKANSHSGSVVIKDSYGTILAQGRGQVTVR